MSILAFLTGGIGGIEVMLIFVAVLLLFGAKKLPGLAKGMGKAMGEFKSAQREFQDEIRRAEYEVQEEARKLEMRRDDESEILADESSSEPDESNSENRPA